MSCVRLPFDLAIWFYVGTYICVFMGVSFICFFVVFLFSFSWKACALLLASNQDCVFYDDDDRLDGQLRAQVEFTFYLFALLQSMQI